jgi:hypothetical protein
MEGAGIRAIQEALGHKSVAMTVRYSHLSPEFVRDAVNKLVPPKPDADVSNRTDTRTDTEELESVQSPSQSVH